MVTAFVLINVEDRHLQEIAAGLKQYEGIDEVHVVAGEYDMLAVVRVEDNAALARLLTDNVMHTPGVQRTKTLISLQQ
jgi:DNA-binding Lrp family transcriptional regulator